MLKTKSRIGKRFDGTLGPVGFFFWSVPDQPQEPTPQTLKWLQSVAITRATGQKIVAGKLNGLWVEIEGAGAMLGTYAVRQLPDGTSPAFYSPLTQQKIMYAADIHAATLRADLECLFIYDPRGDSQS